MYMWIENWNVSMKCDSEPMSHENALEPLYKWNKCKVCFPSISIPLDLDTSLEIMQNYNRRGKTIEKRRKTNWIHTCITKKKRDKIIFPFVTATVELACQLS